MKPKTIHKIAVDWLMFILLMVQMGRHLWGNLAHEWTGAGMFTLFIVHQGLNLNWYKTVFKGKYTIYRIMRFIINALILTAMTGMIISGIILSQQVFTFLPVSGGTSFARILHMAATYWGFVLMGLHLGLHWHVVVEVHWKTVMGVILKPPKKPHALPIPKTIMNTAGIAVAAYGLYAFIHRGLPGYMFVQNQFVFFDFGESKIFFYLDYLSMTVFFAWAAHHIAKLLRTDSTGGRKQHLKKERSRRNFIKKSALALGAVVTANIKWTGNVFAALMDKNNTEMECPENFVLIKGGTFKMGSPGSEAWRGNDEDLHWVSVNDFYMSIHEVTQKEYQEIMGNNPSTFSGENLPVENISWFDAVAFCNAKSKARGLDPVYTIDSQNVTWSQAANGYRLPTEAEWEYACRAGTTTPFNTRTSISAEQANYYGHYPYEIEENYFSQGNLKTRPGRYRETTIAVGSFPANGWGVYDMHGNVGEWCWDYYGAYNSGPRTNPTGTPSGSLRVNRGGGWNDFAKHLRSAYRSSTPPDKAGYNLGMRLVLGAAVADKKVTDTAHGTNTAAGNGKPLIVYFSWSGNTRGIAHRIQQVTGADIFEIKPVTPYSPDYNTVLDQAQRDQHKQARPKLARHVKKMAQYDTIILGYPNWWASIPMPVASFLEEYDFAGKTIVPFCSHGGGRLGQSLTAIVKLVPDVTLGESLSVHYSGGSDLPDEILAWLRGNKIATQR